MRRRLRNGLTATAQYTLAKATDDAASYAGANLSGTAFAQNWLDLEAERGPSSFDQRHLLTVQFQYTTGVGVAGGALVDGWRGSLLKGWTITSQLTAGSAPAADAVLPDHDSRHRVHGGHSRVADRGDDGCTSRLLPQPGGVHDAGVRANGAMPDATPREAPAQFGLNAGITRTFPWGSRLNMDWRIDATNVLNRVTYSSVNALVGSPQFGLPSAANQMRRVQTSLRMRF